MAENIVIEQNNAAENLSFAEQSEIENKIDYEIVSGHYKMLTIGAVANAIGGLVYVLVMFHYCKAHTLFAWYLVLILTSLIDILWAWNYRSNNITLQELKNWRKGFLVIVAMLGLTWGSIGVLFVSLNNHEQIITYTFLLAVLICFAFSTSMDFTVAVVSIACILMPTITTSIAAGITNLFGTTGEEYGFDFAIGFAFTVLGVFILVASYFGDTIVRKFFRLSFENMLFSKKVKNMNKILEDKVKERTIELEHSLTLVNFQATHDLLTELPNARQLITNLEEAIENAARNKSKFAVACFSLNGLQLLHEGLGPDIVDNIIKRVAQRFKNMFMNDQLHGNGANYQITLARRDDFIIIMQPITNTEDAEAKASALFSLLNEPIGISNQTLTLTASIGVSVFPIDSIDVNTLIMHAGAAKMRATLIGGNSVCVYQAKDHANLFRQIDIENQLSTALKNNEFVLEYQPIIDLKTGKICCAEALLRWVNPKLGSLAPDEFIHIIEANGMIIPVGNWILQTACKQTAAWHKNGFNTMKVSINLSYKQLQQKDIVKVLTQILEKTKVDPKSIEFELLERQAFLSESIPLIKQIKSLGISLAIDDFGTGYSALSSLKLFEIDKIKIDKSFIQDISSSSDSRNIVINTISLAKSMNATVVAEGVETAEQAIFLKEHGCDQAQGYYFSPPVPVNAILGLLKTSRFVI